MMVGCSGGTSGTPTRATGPSLDEVTPVVSPRDHVGPSTALLAHPDVVPVATAPKPQLPVTVTDMQGTAVTVTDASRILALDIYGSTSRIVYELGLGDNVVGRDVSSDFPEIADKPLVTANGHELSGEAILALDPTVIITDTSLGPWDVILQMREAGIPVVVVDPTRSMDTIGPLIQTVADALGVPDAGTQLAARATGDVAAKIAQIAAIAPADPTQKLRIAFLYVRGASSIYYLFGGGTGADALITALGAIDVATEIGWDGMKPVSDEGLVAAQPDLILMMSDGLASVDGVDGLLAALPAIATTPAGQHRRIVDMADTQILGFGPQTAAVLDALAVAIYAPDAAADAATAAAAAPRAHGGA